MLEIIHDIAPGSPLAFHTADPNPQNFAAGITALAAAGAKVENDDIGYPDSPFFNDGIIAQAAQDVVAQGVFYDSAAGNDNSQGWQDVWRPINTTVAGVSGTFEDIIGGSPLQTFTLPVNGQAQIDFQWDSAFLEGGSSLPNFTVPNSLEVLITTANGANLLGRINTNALNTGEAAQIFSFTNNGSFGTNNFAMAFRLVTGPAPNHLRWVDTGDDIGALREGAPTTWGQPAASGIAAVGAVDWSKPNQPESFTSLGTGLIFTFDSAGNRLATPEVRNKPEVAGPVGVSTSFFGSPNPSGGFPQFFGTSAATPHVAAAAALLFQQAPTISVAGMIQHLEQTAKDMPPPGFDGLTGAGLIQLVPISIIPAGSTVVATGDGNESNQTSDAAQDFGPLVPGTSQVLLKQDITATNTGGLDYDWFRWEPASNGTFTVSMATTSGGDLELHLFTLLGNSLVEVAKSTAPGQPFKLLTIGANAGQPMLVEVKGRNSSFGHWDGGTYELAVGM
jgi:hypothetical protein